MVKKSWALIATTQNYKVLQNKADRKKKKEHTPDATRRQWSSNRKKAKIKRKQIAKPNSVCLTDPSLSLYTFLRK